MSGLTPFRRSSSLFRTDFPDFSNFIDNFFNDMWSFPFRRSFFADTFRIDVQESDKEYYIEAELPGVKKEDINLELDDGRLLISVERSENIDEENKNYIHKERRYASMQRSVYLSDAKPDGIKAKLKDGVLSIRVEKENKGSNRKRIEIE